MNKQPKPGKLIFALLFGILFLFGITIFALANWYSKSFGVSFKELIYTVLSPLKGTGGDTVRKVVLISLKATVYGGAVYLLICVPLFLRSKYDGFFRSRRLKRKNAFLYRIRREVWLTGEERPRYLKLYAWQKRFRTFGATVVLVFLAFSLCFAVVVLGIPEYVLLLRQKTTIYEDHYVSPDDVTIEASGKPKNVIWIYVESMETAGASKEDGGLSERSLMPELTRLARENTSFSEQTDGKLGGFLCPVGTGWTVAALLASTSGIPFSFELGEGGGNDMGEREKFASGLTTFGDILEEKGYRQEFICGSDIRFGGRDLYYTQHGNFEIYDLFTARERGAVAPDYDDGWWGFEDYILYDIAKTEVKKLAESGEPFNLTLLTVDTHFPYGHPCAVCGNEESWFERVVCCADRQAAKFVEWCSEQDFFDDTLIILTGDHPRMDTLLADPDGKRPASVYNCFVNPAVTPKKPTDGRTVTTFDLFPTALAAMGFEIEGDRLGLGVNLFSDLPTLSEEYGYKWLETEIRKFSDYYLLHFS